MNGREEKFGVRKPLCTHQGNWLELEFCSCLLPFSFSTNSLDTMQMPQWLDLDLPDCVNATSEDFAFREEQDGSQMFNISASSLCSNHCENSLSPLFTDMGFKLKSSSRLWRYLSACFVNLRPWVWCPVLSHMCRIITIVLLIFLFITDVCDSQHHNPVCNL